MNKKQKEKNGIKRKKLKYNKKALKKEKIMKIKKNNKVEFVSAEFSACLLASPSRCDSGVI